MQPYSCQCVVMNIIELSYLTNHGIGLSDPLLHYITLHFITFHYIALHYIALYLSENYLCVPLHYITQHFPSHEDSRYLRIRHATLLIKVLLYPNRDQSLAQFK
jgi:hypothetical protein